MQIEEKEGCSPSPRQYFGRFLLSCCEQLPVRVAGLEQDTGSLRIITYKSHWA